VIVTENTDSEIFDTKEIEKRRVNSTDVEISLQLMPT